MEFLALKTQEEINDILERTNGYCPCVPKHERSKDNECFCKTFRTEGICQCGFYELIKF